jgi:hypothetical protein
MFALLFLFACGEKADDTAQPEPTDQCSGETYEQVLSEVTPGWTPADGCEVLCPEVDGSGNVYTDCYFNEEEAVVCQYVQACG